MLDTQAHRLQVGLRTYRSVDVGSVPHAPLLQLLWGAWLSKSARMRIPKTTDGNPNNKELTFSKELIESISMTCGEEEKQTKPKNLRAFVSKLLEKQDMLHPEHRTRNQTEFI